MFIFPCGKYYLVISELQLIVNGIADLLIDYDFYSSISCLAFLWDVYHFPCFKFSKTLYCCEKISVNLSVKVLRALNYRDLVWLMLMSQHVPAKSQPGNKFRGLNPLTSKALKQSKYGYANLGIHFLSRQSPPERPPERQASVTVTNDTT